MERDATVTLWYADDTVEVDHSGSGIHCYAMKRITPASWERLNRLLSEYQWGVMATASGIVFAWCK